jgi:hypothetical protein
VSEPVEKTRKVSRLAAALAAPIGLCCGLFAVGGDVDAARRRYADDEGRLQSDRVIFATRTSLERERRDLGRRHHGLASGAAESEFVRTLAQIARRHGVIVSAIDLTSDVADAHRSERGNAIRGLGLRVELRGSYRALLASLVELARDSDAVHVDTPSFHADGGGLAASIPVIILRPELPHPSP